LREMFMWFSLSVVPGGELTGVRHPRWMGLVRYLTVTSRRPAPSTEEAVGRSRGPGHRLLGNAPGQRRSSQATCSSESETLRPRIDDRASEMVRGPNNGNVGNGWCST